MKMKVTLGVEEIKNIVDITTKFVAKNNTLPILQNLYIQGAGNTLIIRATDMEKYIEINLDANISGEGALTVDARMFSEIIKNNEDDHIDLVIDQEKDTLTIKSIYDQFVIKGISASEYVALPEMNATQVVSIPAQTLSVGIQSVEYAVTEKNFSPIFTGVLIKTKKYQDGNKVIFVGTDSFRLAEYKVEFDGEINEEMSIIIPKSSVNDINAIASFVSSRDKDNIVTINLSKNLVKFDFVLDTLKISATSLLIQGNFPDYENEKIMPIQFKTNVVLNKANCEKAIKKIAILTKDINNYIEIEIIGNDIKIRSGDTDKGDGNTKLQAKTEGGDLTLGLNGKHVTDFLRTIEGDEVILNMNDNQSPLILTNKNDPHYRYVIRPINK